MNKKLLLTLLVSSALVGCNGSGGSSSGSNSGDSGGSTGTLFSGKVLGELEPVSAPAVTSVRSSNDNAVQSGDYLENALVFVDLNYNGVLDSGEPSARTDSNGSYTMNIEDSKRDCGKLSPVLAVIKNNGYEYTMSVAPNELREGGLGDAMDITPVTTKVWDLVLIENAEGTCETAESTLKTVLDNAEETISEEIFGNRTSILKLYSDYSETPDATLEAKAVTYNTDVAKEAIIEVNNELDEGVSVTFGTGKNFYKYGLDPDFHTKKFVLITEVTTETVPATHTRKQEYLIEDDSTIANLISLEDIRNTGKKYVDVMTMETLSESYSLKYDAVIVKDNSDQEIFSCLVKESYSGENGGKTYSVTNNYVVPESQAILMPSLSSCHYTALTDAHGTFSSEVDVESSTTSVKEVVKMHNETDKYSGSLDVVNLSSSLVPTDSEVDAVIAGLAADLTTGFSEAFSSVSIVPDQWSKERVEYNVCSDIELIRYAVAKYSLAGSQEWFKTIVTTGIDEYLLTPASGVTMDETNWSDPLNWEHQLPGAPSVCGH
jgi:hypothetical protein